MRYRTFGHSGLRVSELFLGTMTFGDDWGWGAPEEECRKMFTAYAEAGGNVIDTANKYTEGSSERIVGELIASEREGRYPGGTQHAFQRYGVLGAYIGYWSMKGLAAGLWKEALQLIGSSLPMVLAGVAQRCAARLRGLRPSDTIDVDSRPSTVRRPSTERLA